MTSILRAAPLLIALAAAPAFAQPADDHAAHHPAAGEATPPAAATTPPATADARPGAMQGCPMTKGQTAGGQMMGGGKGSGQMAMGSGQMQHCNMMGAAAGPSGQSTAGEHRHKHK